MDSLDMDTEKYSDVFNDIRNRSGEKSISISQKDVSLQDIHKQMDLLIKKMEYIETKVEAIESILTNDISKKCDKMGEHIDFIDNVYTSVQKPLGYLCGKVNRMVGFGGSDSNNEMKALPDIEKKDI